MGTVCCSLVALTSAIVFMATGQQPMGGPMYPSIGCCPVAMDTIARVSASSVQQTALWSCHLWQSNEAHDIIKFWPMEFANKVLHQRTNLKDPIIDLESSSRPPGGFVLFYVWACCFAFFEIDGVFQSLPVIICVVSSFFGPIFLFVVFDLPTKHL